MESITLTNNCSLQVEQSILTVLKHFVKEYNRDNDTTYCLNDIKYVSITSDRLSVGFGPHNWMSIVFYELKKKY